MCLQLLKIINPGYFLDWMEEPQGSSGGGVHTYRERWVRRFTCLEQQTIELMLFPAFIDRILDQ